MKLLGHILRKVALANLILTCRIYRLRSRGKQLATCLMRSGKRIKMHGQEVTLNDVQSYKYRFRWRSKIDSVLKGYRKQQRIIFVCVILSLHSLSFFIIQFLNETLISTTRRCISILIQIYFNQAHFLLVLIFLGKHVYIHIPIF